MNEILSVATGQKVEPRYPAARHPSDEVTASRWPGSGQSSVEVITRPMIAISRATITEMPTSTKV